MYTVSVESKLSSAHNLRGYRGKCEELHGHNWRVRVSVSSPELDEMGMVCDFHDIKKALNAVIEKLDHKYLNDVGHFKTVNPTSENIARYIFDSLRVERPDLDIAGVTVWETDNSSASYSDRSGV